MPAGERAGQGVVGVKSAGEGAIAALLEFRSHPEVPLLRGGTVKARISSSHTEPDKRGGFAGTVVSEIIYADEI